MGVPSIAVAQTCPVRSDVRANIEAHLRLAHIAASEGASVVVFPELSLTGYELDVAAELAFSDGDARLDPLLDAAMSAAVTLVVGAPVRVADRLQVGALVLLPDANMTLYTKRRLGAFSESARRDGIPPPPESTVFTSGELDPMVHVGTQTAAIAICADIGDPAHVRRAAERGVAVYLASMFVIPSEFEDDSRRLQSYAAHHSLWVAFANYGGATGGLAAAGRSSIISPEGKVVVELGSSGSGVAGVAARTDGWRAWSHMLDGRR